MTFKFSGGNRGERRWTKGWPLRGHGKTCTTPEIQDGDMEEGLAQAVEALSHM